MLVELAETIGILARRLIDEGDEEAALEAYEVAGAILSVADALVELASW